MSAQPIGHASARPLRVLPIPDHTVPSVPVEQPDSGVHDARQLAIRLEPATSSASGPGRVRRPTRMLVTAPSRSLSEFRFRDVDDDDEFDPCPKPLERPTELPELHRWVTKLVPALLEAAAGTRPVPQLMRWVSPPVYEALLRRHGIAVRRGAGVRRPTRVLRVVLREPRHAVVEASVVFTDGLRVRAAALRFVPVDGRWVADAFEVG